jgi:rhodanese-related sulfurtransferase
MQVAKIAPNEVNDALGDSTIYVLDVRPLDFALDNAFIRGSHHCALVHLANRHTEIPRDRKIIISDWAMKQSPSAAKYLMEKGYSILGILKGGMERWNSENLPVERRDAASTLMPLAVR